MAIAIDTNGGFTPNGNLTLTTSVTLSGSNRVLVVWYYNEAIGGLVTSITHDGNAMTQFESQVCPNAGTSRTLYGFYLIAPNTGTHDIVCTRPSTAGGQHYGAYVNLTGAKQSGQPEAQNKTAINNASGTFNLAVTTLTSGAGVLGSQCNESTTAGVASGTTSLNTSSGVTSARTTTFPSGAAGSYQIGWTGTANNNIAAITAAFAEAAAAGPTGVKTFDGVTQSSGIKSYMGVTTGTTKSVNGVT